MRGDECLQRPGERRRLGLVLRRPCVFSSETRVVSPSVSRRREPLAAAAPESSRPPSAQTLCSRRKRCCCPTLWRQTPFHLRRRT